MHTPSSLHMSTSTPVQTSSGHTLSERAAECNSGIVGPGCDCITLGSGILGTMGILTPEAAIPLLAIGALSSSISHLISTGTFCYIWPRRTMQQTAETVGLASNQLQHMSQNLEQLHNDRQNLIGQSDIQTTQVLDLAQSIIRIYTQITEQLQNQAVNTQELIQETSQNSELTMKIRTDLKHIRNNIKSLTGPTKKLQRAASDLSIVEKSQQQTEQNATNQQKQAKTLINELQKTNTKIYNLIETIQKKASQKQVDIQHISQFQQTLQETTHNLTLTQAQLDNLQKQLPKQS